TPVDLALKPDGGELLVSNFAADSISILETGPNEAESSHLIGRQPVRGLVNAGNSLLYVSNFGSDSVGVFGIDNRKLLATVRVGSRPDALALTTDQGALLVADTASGDVAVVFVDERNSQFTLFTMIPVGLAPNQIAVKSFMATRPPAQ
ncbi:MAG TPA: YncE family protein, partial [Terriglobales bacterium]|nr:YncE family protein [Terriglobales bacterium]